MAETIPAQREFTVNDLDRFPSDGNRYELIEGSLHVNPSPGVPHQRAVARLHLLLEDRCPPELEVFFAPLDVVLGPATLLVPDLLVVPLDVPGGKRIDGPPLLVVEVLSPSTRLYDLGAKRLAYRDAGVSAYWVVDLVAPSLTEWRWVQGEETERTVAGDDEVELDWPFPVTVSPSRLVPPG